MTDDAKRKFLRSEILLATLNASLATRNEKAKVYAAGVGEDEKTEVRAGISKRLTELDAAYLGGGVTGESHCENIESFAGDLGKEFRQYFEGQRFRIGITQKLVNLYLKYIWVLEWIPEPPHCPFDGVVISHIAGLPAESRNWTALDNLDAYRKLVDLALKTARDQKYSSLAIWELENYEKWRTKRLEESVSAELGVDEI